nr:ribokinase [uncultured Lachnoclostridium sp.]
MKKILVVGSLNMDCMIETEQMPRPGETVLGKSVTLIPGGKGANQAYAAGKLGGKVGMIGAVGSDAYGRKLKENLESVGVDTSSIEVISGGATGQAFITVDDEGENSIIVIQGTNGDVTRETIHKYISRVQESDIVIMQLEIPVDTVQYIKELANQMGKIVIIDPAPAQADLPDSFWKGVDFIKPNESELEILTGKTMDTVEDIKKGARKMLEKGVKGVIVTLGEEGCLLVTKEREDFFETSKVRACDTTAAGDSFTGAFAVALSEGKDCADAIRFGQKASAVTVTRKGAQTSMPDRSEVTG